MNSDELEELIKKLLAKGVTVLVLVSGPAGQLIGVTPGDAAAPPAVSAQPSAPSTRDAPKPGTPRTAPGTGPAPVTGGPSGASAVPTVPPEGTWSNPAPDGTGTANPDGGEGTGDSGGAGGPEPGGPESDGTEPDGTASSDPKSGDPKSGDPKSGDPKSGDDSGTRSGSDGTVDGGGSRERGTGQSPGGGATGPGGAEAGSGNGTTGTNGHSPAAGTGGGAGVSTGQGRTAAQAFGWGNPVRADDFTDGTEGWSIYDGPGHAGNGRRTPDAVSVRDSVLTITGDADGNTAGMAWTPGQKYGRWEGRVRAPASDPSYNALLLLWPDGENFPEGGEVDFMEMMDHTRQKTNLFLHYGSDNSQVSGDIEIDATQWHNWAVEWTPDHIAAFVDGKQWWKTTDSSILPPGPMHLCVQLDWFPKGGGGAKESTMQVDWVKQYAIDGTSAGGAGAADERGAGGTDGG